jgi:hypothetical protein
MSRKNTQINEKNPFVRAAKELSMGAKRCTTASLVPGDIINFNYMGHGSYTGIVTMTAKRGGPVWFSKTSKRNLLFVYKVGQTDQGISFSRLQDLATNLFVTTGEPILEYIHKEVLYRKQNQLHENKGDNPSEGIEPIEEYETIAEKLGINNFRTFIINKIPIGNLLKLTKQVIK